MTRIDLSALHRAWDEYHYPHGEVHSFDTRPEVGRDLALDVLVFLPEEDPDAQIWFATAGLSEMPHKSDVGRFELELAVRGTMTPDERAALARRFADLAITPLRHDLVVRRDMIIKIDLPGFPDRAGVIVTDVGWSTPEHLPELRPRVRVLECFVLHATEIDQLVRVGPDEACVQFLDAGVDLVDRRRRVVDLEPPDRPVRVRSRAMAKKAKPRDMKAIWADIDKYLAAKAPTTGTDLGPGADAEAIAHVEATIGRKLPPEVVASYKIHDGYAGLTDYEYLSLEAGLELWDANSEEPRSPAPRKSAHQGKIKRAYWHKAWFPVGSDSSGNLMCVDLDPEAGGVLGQIVFWDAGEGPSATDFEGWGDWLAQFRDELLAGKFGTDENGRLQQPNPFE